MFFRLFAALFLLPISSDVFASGGFTWLSGVAHKFHIPEHVVTLILVSLFVLLLGFFYRLKVAKVSNPAIPDKGITFRNFFEALGSFIYNLTKNIMGEKEAKKYFPMVVMIFSFIFLNNVIGLIPGFLPPTDNFNTTLAMGLFVFIYYNVEGIKAQGLVGHIKHFMGPVWYLAFLIFGLQSQVRMIAIWTLVLKLMTES